MGPGADPPPDPVDTGASPDDRVAGAELPEAVQGRSDRLPGQAAGPLLLTMGGDCTFEEMAAVLGAKPGTLKWRVMDARQRIKAGWRREDTNGNESWTEAASTIEQLDEALRTPARRLRRPDISRWQVLGAESQPRGVVDGGSRSWRIPAIGVRAWSHSGRAHCPCGVRALQSLARPRDPRGQHTAPRLRTPSSARTHRRHRAQGARHSVPRLRACAPSPLGGRTAQGGWRRANLP